MSDDDLKEPLQSLAPVLDHVVREAIGEHFARQRRDSDTRGFALKDLAKVFEIAVSSTDAGEPKLRAKRSAETPRLAFSVRTGGNRQQESRAEERSGAEASTLKAGMFVWNNTEMSAQWAGPSRA